MIVYKRFVTKAFFASYEDFQNNFCIHVPPDFNFAYDVVDVIAAENPEKKALVWCNDAGVTLSFSFHDMHTKSMQTARFFSSCGISKGDRVMLLLNRRYEFWFCLLALHRIGAVCIPATHLLTAKDIAYRCNSARVKMIVAADEDDLVKHIESSEADCHTLEKKVLVGAGRCGWVDMCAEYESLPRDFERPRGAAAVKSSDTSIIYFTSGTTGMPKMVKHSFAYPLGHIVTARFWQCVQPEKLHFTLAESGWAKALWGKIYGQWLCDAPVFVYDFEKFNAKNLLSSMSKHRVASFCAPPTVYRFLLEENFKNYDLSSLESCSIAGEAYDVGLYNSFYNATGIKLKNAYGQTETTVVLGCFPGMAIKPCSMGKPAPGYHVELFNEHGRPCNDGETGEIVLRVDREVPPGFFNGYYRDQDYTDKVWHDGYYYTGDLARRDAEGYYWFVGRNDSLIKSSGYRIGPYEVESVLLEHSAVKECKVTGQPDPDRGQAVKAFVVLREGYAPGRKLVKELQDYVKSVTAPYKYPRYIEFVEEIPKTFNGKIKRS